MEKDDLKLGKTELLTLYKFSADEEHRELDMHHKRIAFFAGSGSALFLAAIIGTRFADNWIHFVALAFVVALVVPLTRLGREVSRQFYERFLSAVTMRAKLEQLLHMTEDDAYPISNPDPEKSFWVGESLIPTRNLESRRTYKSSSQSWLLARMEGGYQRSAQKYFDIIEKSAWAYAGVLILFAISS